MSLRDKIKNTNDINSKIIEMSEWDCSIEIRTMTAKQRANILREVTDKDGKLDQTKLGPFMIIESCFDTETGEMIFEKEDAEWIMDKASGPVEKLMAEVMNISGFGRDAVEDAEKN